MNVYVITIVGIAIAAIIGVRVAGDRIKKYENGIGWVLLVAMGIAFGLFAFLVVKMPLITILAILAGVIVFGVLVLYASAAAKRSIAAEDKTRSVAQWSQALKYWDVNTPLPEPRFPLKSGEIIYYNFPTKRYKRMRVGQRIDTTTKGGIGPALVGGVLAGATGAIVGAQAGKKTTTGTVTDVENVVEVDRGPLAITNQRIVFLGHESTLEVPATEVLDITLRFDDIAIAYPGRAASERFSVDPLLFRACMVLRAGDKRFTLPEIPKDLPREAFPMNMLNYD